MVCSSFSKYPAKLTGVVEHFLNTLDQGRQYCFPEQGVQPRKEQSSQHHGNEDFDGGVNVAFPGIPREDGAAFGSRLCGFVL